jgi:C4-dicarboxylate-specific signal transduction histidine kinase
VSEHLPLVETARLVALWRLAAGAAHATNNLTAILGEASYLRDEWKADAQVVSCCESIMVEVDRCARLTRALLSRRQPSQSGDEVDLGRLLGQMRDVLPDTLGRRYDLHVEPGNDLYIVSGTPDELEMLVLFLVQAACGLAGETARLDLGVEAGAVRDRVTLRLSLDAPDLAADAAYCTRDADTITDPALRTLWLAAQQIAANLGSRLDCTLASGRLQATVELRLVPDAS